MGIDTMRIIFLSGDTLFLWAYCVFIGCARNLLEGEPGCSGVIPQPPMDWDMVDEAFDEAPPGRRIEEEGELVSKSPDSSTRTSELG